MTKKKKGKKKGSKSAAFSKTYSTGNPRIVMIDDLIATGGTANAGLKLIKQADGEIVESCFILNLVFLKAKEKLEKIAPVYTLLDIK